MKVKNSESYYEVKSSNISTKDDIKIDPSKRTVTNVYSAYNYYDGQDVCLPNCFKKSIQENGPGSSATCKIKRILYHDLTRPIGTISSMEDADLVDLKGRKYVGGTCTSELNPTQDGNDALINYQMKTFDNHSYGYEAKDYEWITKDGHGNSKQWDNMVKNLVNPEDLGDATDVRLLKQVRLYEISTVLFGMNNLTPVLGIKSGDVSNMDLIQYHFNEKLKSLNTYLRIAEKDRDSDTVDLIFQQIKQLFAEVLQAKNEIIEPPKPPKQKTVDNNESKESFSFPSNFSIEKENNNSGLNLPTTFSL